MQTKILFTVNPTGAIPSVTTAGNALYQGQIGTVDYRLEMAQAANLDNWRPTDVVLMRFTRPDGRTNQQVMRYVAGGWELTSNGWETDVNISAHGATLTVSFICKRYSTVDATRVVAEKTTQAVTLQLQPSAGYTPLNIADDDAEEILAQLAQYNADLLGVDDDLQEHKSKTNNPHGVTKAQVGLGNVKNKEQLTAEDKAVPGGVASLDGAGEVPLAQIPQLSVDKLPDTHQKMIKDFTVNSLTGVGTKYYTDGTIATVNYPIGTSGAASNLINLITFGAEHFVDGEIAFTALQTGQEDNHYLAFLDRGDGEGFRQTANSVFKGSDGSALISGVTVPFDGRLLVIGAGTAVKFILDEMTGSSTTKAPSQAAVKAWTYSREQINQMLGGDGIALQVVETLPDAIDALPNIIYLVPADTPEEANYYEEYLRVNNVMELIGTTNVDLTPYAKKADLKNYAINKEGDSVNGEIYFKNRLAFRKSLYKGLNIFNPKEIVYDASEYSLTINADQSFTLQKLVSDAVTVPYYIHNEGSILERDYMCFTTTDPAVTRVYVKDDGNPDILCTPSVQSSGILYIEEVRQGTIISFEMLSLIEVTIQVNIRFFDTTFEEIVERFEYLGRFITELDFDDLLDDELTPEGKIGLPLARLSAEIESVPVAEGIPETPDPDKLYMVEGQLKRYAPGDALPPGAMPGAYPGTDWASGAFGEMPYFFANRQSLLPLPAGDTIYVKMLIDGATAVKTFTRPDSGSPYMTEDYMYTIGNGFKWDDVTNPEEPGTEPAEGWSVVWSMDTALTSLELISASTDPSGEPQEGAWENVHLITDAQKALLDNIDTEPTEESAKLVRSGGVYSMIQSVQAGQTLRTVLTFADTDFVNGAIELDALTTGLVNDTAQVTVERAISGGYVQTANAVIKYSDGSIKLDGVMVPFSGRFVIII